MMARIILNRFNIKITPHVLPETPMWTSEQLKHHEYGFQSLADSKEQCTEQSLKMYAVFIDFIKVFDIVSREELCLVLKKFGCTQNVINLIKTLCNGMQANVVQGNEVLDQFAVTNCLKQGCVLASTLLSLCLTALLHVPSEM